MFELISLGQKQDITSLYVTDIHPEIYFDQITASIGTSVHQPIS